MDTKTKRIAEARERLWVAQRAKLSPAMIIKLKKALAEAEESRP